MTGKLEEVYRAAGALDRYFDKTTPVDLFRGQRDGDHSELMQPSLIGWYAKLKARSPDVLVKDAGGNTPQYTSPDFSELVVEGKDKLLTAEILKNADQYIVKGCLTMRGDHRGISVFDKKNLVLRGFKWHKMPKGSEIPAPLAITRDFEAAVSAKPIHYTIAPKNDMPLSLFLQYLRMMAAQAILDE